MELRTEPTGSIFPADVVNVSSHHYTPGVVTFVIGVASGKVVEFNWTSEFAELVGRALVLESQRTRCDKEKGPRC